MRSNVLVARICRVIETNGESGDGASLAVEYATSVERINERLESVVSAVDTKSISDAIRLLTEEPPILEEASALDFFQLQDWENLCETKGWKAPAKLDQALLGRAVAVGETKDAIAPFLTLYKKAVRVGNPRLAVKSLRRLVELDHEQDWTGNLRQSERQMQERLVREFREARERSQTDVCDQLAHELLDESWMDGVDVNGADEVIAYREMRLAERRDAEGREDVAILKGCLGETWNRELAVALVRAVDDFVSKGWTIPDDGADVVAACRARCRREIASERKARRIRLAVKILLPVLLAWLAVFASVKYLASRKAERVRCQNEMRVSQLSNVLDELEKVKRDGWTNCTDAASVADRIRRADSLIARDDANLQARLSAVKESWNDFGEAMRSSLLLRLGTLTAQLTNELATVFVENERTVCEKLLKRWRSLWDSGTKAAGNELSAAEKALADAVATQCVYRCAFERLKGAQGALAILDARQMLLRSFGNYAEVKRMEEMEVSSNEVASVLSDQVPMVTNYLKSVRRGVTSAAFEKFLQDRVRVIADSPEYYSVYGWTLDESNVKIVPSSAANGVCEPEIQAVSLENGSEPTIDETGGAYVLRRNKARSRLLSLTRRMNVSEITSRDVPLYRLAPSSLEMRKLVETARRANLSQDDFEARLLGLIKRHLVASHKVGFVEQETKWWSSLDGGLKTGRMSAYRRVQFVAWYMWWLINDLNLMPEDRELLQWYEKLNEMAASIEVAGIDESMSWLCLWDDAVRMRTIKCAELLASVPVDWCERYRAAQRRARAFEGIADWRVRCAGKVGLDSYVADCPKTPEDHPLYVLRRIAGGLALVCAFEPRNGVWQQSPEVSLTKGGLVLGEPLYHVVSKASQGFIDCRKVLREMAVRSGMDDAEIRNAKIPFFAEGGL